MTDQAQDTVVWRSTTVPNVKSPQGSGAGVPHETPVRLPELPEPFLLQLIKRLPQEDAKSLRSTCSRLCALCNSASRLLSLKASALLLDTPPTLSHLPPISFLDFNARNAACSHQLLAALRQHGSRLGQSVRSVRLSGRDGLLAALQTLRLACPSTARLEIRCQHSYRGRHKECADLGRCLRELETGFPALTELHLHRLPVSSSQLVHLCDALPGLRALSVRGLVHALTSDSLVHLHRLSQLVSLSVDHLRLQGRHFPCGPQLRSLELSDATITADSFATLNSLTGLQSLSLWGTGHRSAIAFTPLTSLAALRRLHLELVLDQYVLAGLQSCTALTSLSAQAARVVAPVSVTASCIQDAAATAGQQPDTSTGRTRVTSAGVPVPPQLPSVMRLSLESLAEDCLPLAAWLPGLRSLVLREDDGAGGVWRAVAGHECLTSLRVAEGGCLPRQARPGEVTCDATKGAEGFAREASKGDGTRGELAAGVQVGSQGGASLAYSCCDAGQPKAGLECVGIRVGEVAAQPPSHHHNHNHHHHGVHGIHHLHHRHSLERYLGGDDNGDSSDSSSSRNSRSSSSSSRSSNDGSGSSTGGASGDIAAVAPSPEVCGATGVQHICNGSVPGLVSATAGSDGCNCPIVQMSAAEGAGGYAWVVPGRETAIVRGGDSVATARMPPSVMKAPSPAHTQCEDGVVAQHSQSEQADKKCPPLVAGSGHEGQSGGDDRQHVTAEPLLSPPPPPHLTHLRLGSCEGLPEQDYISCAPLPALTSCDLSGCACLTPAALARLLGCMTALRELSLEGAPHLTDQALMRLGAGVGGGAGIGIADGNAAPLEDGPAVSVRPSMAVGAVACAPTVAAVALATAAATGVPMPPCSACAGMAITAATAGAEPPEKTAVQVDNCQPPIAPAGFPRSSSAAALAAAAAMCGPSTADTEGVAGRSAGAVMALRRLELTRLPLITARGVAAAAAGLPRLTELRVASCQAVCREACVWLPQQLGRPALSVVCSHAPVYDDH